MRIGENVLPEDLSDTLTLKSLQLQVNELNESIGVIAQAVMDLQSDNVAAEAPPASFLDKSTVLSKPPVLRLVPGPQAAIDPRGPAASRMTGTSDGGRKDWIVTASGRRFYPLDPRGEDVDIGDIAHALGNICRFIGACRPFYSVAEHCVHVSMACDPEDALWGLLHDASEFALSDVNTIVKNSPLMAGYREIEAQLERVIFERFGLFGPRPPSVKVADLRMLATEARQLMPPNEPFGTAEPVDTPIRGLSPADATAAFLYRFTELTEQQHL